MIVTASGYITNYRVANGRKPARTDAERAQLLGTMAAWTGHYRVDGNKLLVKIDSSWNENDTGSEYPRTFVLEGNKLTVTTRPRGATSSKAVQLPVMNTLSAKINRRFTLAEVRNTRAVPM
jgi:hypothetical protein